MAVDSNYQIDFANLQYILSSHFVFSFSGLFYVYYLSIWTDFD
jgi:hypothetical protein